MDIFAEVFDVVVIGGGPSGMMAAGCAAESGAKVLLLEKNDILGKKLRITGGGRCNITNALFEPHMLAAKFGAKGKLLVPAFARFGVRDTFDFFEQRGLPLKTEAENRVFPQSESAEDVCETLIRYMQTCGVTIAYGVHVQGFEVAGQQIVGIHMANGKSVRARQYIVATGGTSRPETGSTGDGFVWLRDIGHTIVKADASLVPIVIQEAWVKQLQGISLSDVRVSVIHDTLKHKGACGKILFTHFGVSGPLILNMSQQVRAYVKQGSVQLSLDMFPQSDQTSVERRLRTLFEQQPNRKLKNVLEDFCMPALAQALVLVAAQDDAKPVREVTKQERLALAHTAKDMRMTVAGFLGLSKAIVSSGGVCTDEIDFRTMRSRLYSNLFVIGDSVDIPRPSGGYSLQLCWTTGFLAGKNAVAVQDNK